MLAVKHGVAPAGVGKSELVSALSYALDISEGHPTGHCVRACWIGSHIGRAVGLSPRDLSHLYYTLLLKDVGCSSNAARICKLYLADDIALKQDFHLVRDSLPQVLGFVLSRTGMKAKLAERFRALLNIAVNGGTIVNELFQTRCHAGADIVRQMRFPEEVAQGVLDGERVVAVRLTAKTSGAHTLRVYGLAAGVVLDRLTLDPAGAPAAAEPAPR